MTMRAFDGHIIRTSGTRGGQPRIADSRITVADVALLHLRLGKSVEEIADTYGLSLGAVHAALSYYYDHQTEVDASIEEDAAFAEAFRRENPSPLREKLKSLAGG